MTTAKKTNGNSELKNKINALESAVSSIESNLVKVLSCASGNKNVQENIPVVSSGCLSLDLALGCGGYPKGRIVEIYGPESSGKTTLTLHAVAEAQKQKGVCAFIDAEHALDTNYAKKIGVNLDNLLIAQPDTGEQALDIVETLVRSESVDLVVVDSVAALIPKAELEGDMGDKHASTSASYVSSST